MSPVGRSPIAIAIAASGVVLGARGEQVVAGAPSVLPVAKLPSSVHRARRRLRRQACSRAGRTARMPGGPKSVTVPTAMRCTCTRAGAARRRSGRCCRARRCRCRRPATIGPKVITNGGRRAVRVGVALRLDVEHDVVAGVGRDRDQAREEAGEAGGGPTCAATYVPRGMRRSGSLAGAARRLGVVALDRARR